MSDRTCIKCGARFEAEAAKGLCPCCLMDTGLELSQETPPEETPAVAGQTKIPERADTVSCPEEARLGDYQLLEQVGHGGMGIVYKARQISLNRTVAVKMLLAGEYASPAALRRFRAEAESAASLHHPNIVSIYEAGERDGRPYFSMDFVDGTTLAELAREMPLPTTQAARYTSSIAAAVQYAHTNGILHRDLKPGNVLIDEEGQPRITDFGLAKRFEITPPDDEFRAIRPRGGSTGQPLNTEPLQSGTVLDLTLSGQVLGSPNFMAPEQASAKRGVIGPRSDVYGLGAILYYLLTGKPPFHAASVTDTLEQVLNNEPASPHVLNAGVPADLETICLKCLEKEPARRYGSAQEVVDELERFLRSEPIQARPLTPVGRAWRWCRRKPALATLGAAFLLLGLVIIAGSPIAITRIQRERQRAEGEALRNAQNLYAADMSLGFRLLQENHLGQIRDLLARHVPRKGGPDMRGWEWRYLWQESQGDQEFIIGTLSNDVYSIAFSPNGTMLAAGDLSGHVKVWGFQSRKLLTTIPPDRDEWLNARTALGFSSDGRHFAVGTTRGGNTNLLGIWDAATWRRLPGPALVHTGEWIVVTSSFSPGATKLATAVRGSLVVWDLRGGGPLLKQPISFYEPYTACTAFSDNGRFFAYHSSGKIHVWDLLTRQPVVSITAQSDQCVCLAFAPTGMLLAAGFWYEPLIQVWALPEARLVASLETPQRWVRGLDFSPDGLQLASAGADRSIVLWDSTAWKRLRTLKGHSDEIWRVAYSADGKWLASGSKDRTVRLWKLDPLKPKVPFVPYPPDLRPHLWRKAYLCRYGDRFMLTGSNGACRVYSKSALELLREYRLPVSDLQMSEIASDGRHLACWCADGSIRVFETEQMRQTACFQTGIAKQRALAFAPDGKTLAACADTPMMWAWDLESQTEIMKDVHPPLSGVLNVAFSPDGQWFACSQYGEAAVVWELATKRRVAHLKSPGLAVRDTAIDASRRYVATVGDQDDVKLWDPSKQTLIAHLRGSSTVHLSVSFSPDGRRLAAGGGQNITLWDMTTRREVGVLKSPYGAIVWLEFVDDDNTLLVATDKGVFSWRAPSFEEIARQEEQ
ncbi:MAG: protein kinase [Verrucomicrobiia bacterium]